MRVWTDASRTAAEFAFESEAVQRSVRAVLVHYGQILRTRVMANASGRPGPNIVTGDYRRSISMQVRDSGGGTEVTVGTNAPQGRRLEFGFNGMDSLGRRYNQPPFAHWGPAVDETVPELFRAVEGITQ